MRRKSERRKSTDVSSPAPLTPSTRRSSRRRTSTSQSIEPEDSVENQQQDDVHLPGKEEKVSSKEIEREIEEDKKDPRDSSSENSEKDDHGSRSLENKGSRNEFWSGRRQLPAVIEENGNQDEVIHENDDKKLEEEKNDIETKETENSVNNKEENNFGDTASDPSDKNVSNSEDKQNEKEEGETSDSDEEVSKKIREKINRLEKEKEPEVLPPRRPRRRRFDERPEDIQITKMNTDENETQKVSDEENFKLNVSLEPKENENQQNAVNTPTGGPRKRRWLSQKSSELKPKVLAISTDSLKDIISDVPLPVPLSDVRLESSPEPEEIPILEEKINVDIDEEDNESSPTKREKSRDRERKKRDRSSRETREKRSKEKDKETWHEKTAPEETQILNNRKISIITEQEKQAMNLTHPPSPPKNASSTILYITNLVRPFTVLQLKGLLARTGKIVENGFWIDKIKSKCYVQYETEDEAFETRHALHGVRWPSSNPKCLHVDFGTSAAMQKAIASTAEEISKANNEMTKENRTIIGMGWEKDRFENEERKNIQITRPVREWDLGKKEELERENRRNRETERNTERQRNDRSRENKDRERNRDRMDRERPDNRDRDRETERERRRYSNEREIRDRRRSESGSPVQRYKKKNDQPIRLLDDLFRKTKTTPCIYWLPLTPEQIAEKEEARRKRIEQNEIARKEREKERERREKEREREREREREKRQERDRSRERDRGGRRSRSKRRY